MNFVKYLAANAAIVVGLVISDKLFGVPERSFADVVPAMLAGSLVVWAQRRYWP